MSTIENYFTPKEYADLESLFFKLKKATIWRICESSNKLPIKEDVTIFQFNNYMENFDEVTSEVNTSSRRIWRCTNKVFNIKASFEHEDVFANEFRTSKNIYIRDVLVASPVKEKGLFEITATESESVCMFPLLHFLEMFTKVEDSLIYDKICHAFTLLRSATLDINSFDPTMSYSLPVESDLCIDQVIPINGIVSDFTRNIFLRKLNTIRDLAQLISGTEEDTKVRGGWG